MGVSWFGKQFLKSLVTSQAPLRPSLFSEQMRYELEGATAAMKGKKREDCPYPVSDSLAWNFWVYGCDNARGEIRTIREGFLPVWSSTGPYAESPQFQEVLRTTPRVPVEQAMANRWWKPQYTAPADFALIRKSTLYDT